MFLAIDGGGTKTHLLLTEEDGTVISDAQSGPLSLEVVDKKQAQENLFEALKIAKDKANRNQYHYSKVLIGLAGVDTENELDQAQLFFKTILRESVKGTIEVVNDAVIARASGSLKSDGVVIIAGTGSNCVGSNNLGMEAKSGGLGYLLSDEGSGFFIGDKVLRTAIQSADGRGPKTILEDLIKERFQINQVIELKEKINVHNFKKTTISHLAALLPQALETDDEVAKTILAQAILELSKMVYAVANNLNFKDQIFDLVLAGSLFGRKLIDKEIFENKIKEKFPKVNCILPADPPVYGALKLLLQK